MSAICSCERDLPSFPHAAKPHRLHNYYPSSLLYYGASSFQDFVTNFSSVRSYFLLRDG